MLQGEDGEVVDARAPQAAMEGLLSAEGCNAGTWAHGIVLAVFQWPTKRLIVLLWVLPS